MCWLYNALSLPLSLPRTRSCYRFALITLGMVNANKSVLSCITNTKPFVLMPFTVPLVS